MAAKAKPKSKAKPQPKSKAKLQLKSKKKVTTKSNVVLKKPVKPQRSSLTKAKPKKAKADAKSQPKVRGATQSRSRSISTSKKAVKGKAKTVIKVTKTTKPTTSDKKVKLVSIKTKSTPKEDRATGKGKNASIGKAVKAPKVAKGVARNQKPVRVEKSVSASGKKTVGEKGSKSKASKPVESGSDILDVSQVKEVVSSATVVQSSEPLLPNDIDAELDIEVVEGTQAITLESLTSDLADDADDLEVEDLDDDFADDDFAEDSGDEADEDLDLTEDLSEELGPQKFFRDTEMPNDDDDGPNSRSW